MFEIIDVKIVCLDKYCENL